MADPYRLLGLAPGASRDEVRAARLALVKRLHPDLRSTDQPRVRAAAERRLADVNAAYDEVLAAWRTIESPPADPPSEVGGASDASGAAERSGAAGASFAVDAFRPDTFEGLVVAAADLGDVTDVDEPFSLDVFVEGPPRGFCRLELFPEAGGTVVSVDSDEVDPAFVCRVLVEALLRVGLSAHLLAN